ncbi:MAG: hypothetical protein R3Y56_06900 [Akkermansia sp.]
MADTEMLRFDCPEELVDELDILLHHNLLQRSEAILMATINLLDFMEAHRCTSSTPPPYSSEEDGDIAAYIEAMISSPAQELDPMANVVEPLGPDEDGDILLLKSRGRNPPLSNRQ